MLTNRGVIHASSPGSISIGRNQYSLTENVGGLFLAGAGSMINLSASSGATVTRGGTLEGPGQYRGAYTLLDSSEANPVTLRNTTYNIFPNSQLHLVGALLLDDANINIQDDSTPFQAAFLRTDNHVSLIGTGSIRMSPSPNGGIAENFIETPFGSLTVGSNITIFAPTNGGGTISGNYRNDGTIHAQNSLLTIFPNAFTNRGTIRVSDGGTLNLNGSAAIHNAGGTFQTDSNSTFTCTSIHILGGTLEGGTIANGKFLLLDGSQSPLTLRSATVTGGHNTDTSFLGTIELDDATLNPRQIQIGLGNNAAVFKALGPVSLTGVGRVLFGPLSGPNANFLSAANNGSWMLGPRVDLILTADGVGILSAPVTAHGLVRSDANLEIFGPLTIATDGTYSINAGGSILNQGTINPGASPGQLTIAGSLANSPTATLHIEISGTTAITQHDVLQVSGQLVLAGKLGISFPTGFIPQPTARFTIINAGSFTGAFSNVSGGRVVYGSHSFALIQTGNSITLTGYAPVVDPFLPWIDSFPSLTNSADKTKMADPDGDGRLNVVEFVMGTNPGNSLDANRPTAFISGTNAIFTFPRSKKALAANYDIYAIYSERLAPANWIPVPLGMLNVTDNGLLESVVATIQMPPGGTLFITLRVTPP